MGKRTCAVNGCDRPQWSRGWCNTHYSRWLRHGDPLKVLVRTYPTISPCKVIGCERPSKARGWCQTHYALWWTTGDPIPRKRSTTEQNFWAKVEFDPDGCWLWTGCLERYGYGLFSGRYGCSGGVAHRFAYEYTRGVIPPGLHLDHLCHNVDLTCGGGGTCLHRRCVRPDHLEAVSQAENNRRMNARKAILTSR